ncbi:ISPsy22, transposase-like protein [Wolbachia endosymbiont of Armadillidium vulgare str. wVulC]|nr:ISPsy22, transposase-like protein [Wolbachia endosymbiont of Armadillidium vulgare str. wVulC]
MKKEEIENFRMQIICHLYGIWSNRQLCREIHFNVEYR